jgi:hypothetical protein
MHYFLTLSAHKWLSIARGNSFKQDLIVTFVAYVVVAFLIIYLIHFFNSQGFVINNIIPFASLIVDFCIRFLFKENPTSGILPYLFLPIKRQTLVTYILISDFLSIWVIGSFPVYLFILHQCNYSFYFIDILNFVTFFTLILFNNYSIFLIKVLMKEYALFLFPICLVVAIFIQSGVLILNTLSGLFIASSSLFFIATILNIELKRDLYNELNDFAC